MGWLQRIIDAIRGPFGGPGRGASDDSSDAGDEPSGSGESRADGEWVSGQVGHEDGGGERGDDGDGDGGDDGGDGGDGGDD